MTPAPAAVMLPGRPPRPSRRRGVRASGPQGLQATEGGGGVWSAGNGGRSGGRPTAL